MKNNLFSIVKLFTAGLLCLSLATIAFEKPETADVDPETASLQADIAAIKAKHVESKLTASDKYEVNALVKQIEARAAELSTKGKEAYKRGKAELDSLIKQFNQKIENIKKGITE